MRKNEQAAPPPPGIIATLTTGFDLTTKNVWLLVLPIVLDGFLWLGPRLSFGHLIQQMVEFWQREAIVTGLNEDLLLQLAPRTNLFATLSFPVIGVPTYEVLTAPESTPIPTAVINLENSWLWLLLLFLFSLVGLLLTSIYLGMVAEVVRSQMRGGINADLGRDFPLRVSIAWLKLLGAVVVFLIVALIFYVPFLFVIALLSLVSGGLASFILFTGPIFAIWLLFYLCFVPHGLILNRRPILRAMLESVKIVQRNLLATLGLLIGVLAINRGLDSLLTAAENGSWFTAISIVGHAYISTSLIAATFIFYRYRYAVVVPHTAE